jgi:uncharacterized repeat protein (TIGR03803 family)
MLLRKLSLGTLASAILASAVFTAGTLLSAQEKVLYSFEPKLGRDGQGPESSLVFDTAGNLYGTTELGGLYGLGTVYELSPTPGGGWTEKLLHSFGNGADASTPPAGTLVIDSAGNLYGTAYDGGPMNGGSVWELMPNGKGGWKEKVLHNFGSAGDVCLPWAGLVSDASGNLYGTTSSCGLHGYGSAFELIRGAGGTWKEKVLHSFNKDGSDGYYSYGGLALDTAGDLYGTTSSGGLYGNGTVFELVAGAGGAWTEKILHHFNSSKHDGYFPQAGLVLDSAGNLYGTTTFGGVYSGDQNNGTVFELSPRSNGSWVETILHDFNGVPMGDGNIPEANLLLDSDGNLYGTTKGGGLWAQGTVFELSPARDGAWTETILYNFNDTADNDGQFPDHESLIFDGSGNLYGATGLGGEYFGGTVFEVER